MDVSESKILVVDDEPTVRLTLEIALSNEGFTVNTADSAEAATKLLENEKFGVLITDKNLPGKSGVELIRWLRERGDTMPVFLVTGHGSVRSALDTMDLGVEAYLEKPFEDIFAVINRIKEAATAEQQGTRQALHLASQHFGKVSKVFASANAQLRPVQVTIVNPNPVESQWLVDHLHVNAGEVTIVDSPAALEQETRRSPDLLILDAPADEAELDHMVRKIRDIIPHSILVITCTKPTLSAVIRLIDLGVRAVVEKPFEQSTLDDKIGSLLTILRAAGGQPR